MPFQNKRPTYDSITTYAYPHTTTNRFIIANRRFVTLYLTSERNKYLQTILQRHLALNLAKHLETKHRL
jgi:hypothetical protein